jgi:hypothetical protein
MKQLTLPFAAGIILLCAPAVSAQEQAAARELTLRCYLHDPVNPVREPFVFKEPEKSGGITTPVVWDPDNLSQPIKVRAVENTLFLHLPGGGMAARTTVAANINRGIVIVVPTPGAELPFRMVLLDDDPARFPYGTAKVLNMAPADVAVAAGEHKIKLESGKISPIPEVRKVDGSNMAPTNFYVKKDSEWVPITERMLDYSDHLRRVYLIFTPPGSRRPPVVQTLLDRKVFTGQ